MPLGEGRGRDREIAPTALPGRHWGKMEEVAIGRSLLQHCHWKRSPLGEDGRGRDREIAPTALPLGGKEEVAIGGTSVASKRGMEEVAIGRSLLQHCHWGKKRSRSGDRSYDYIFRRCNLPQNPVLLIFIRLNDGCEQLLTKFSGEYSVDLGGDHAAFLIGG